MTIRKPNRPRVYVTLKDAVTGSTRGFTIEGVTVDQAYAKFEQLSQQHPPVPSRSRKADRDRPAASTSPQPSRDEEAGEENPRPPGRTS